MNKRELLDMGLNVFGLDLFVESYNKATNTLLEENPDFPKKKLDLEFEVEVKERSGRNGSVKITIEKLYENKKLIKVDMSEGIKITSEHSSHEDFRELYSYGTKEELIKYHSIAVDYNVALHKVKLKLEQQLKESERVINMVEDNRKMPHHHKDYYERLCCLSERAREYKDKYKVKE